MAGSNESAPEGLEVFILSNCCRVSINWGGVAGVLVGTACSVCVCVCVCVCIRRLCVYYELVHCIIYVRITSVSICVCVWCYGMGEGGQNMSR